MLEQLENERHDLVEQRNAIHAKLKEVVKKISGIQKDEGLKKAVAALKEKYGVDKVE